MNFYFQTAPGFFITYSCIQNIIAKLINEQSVHIMQKGVGKLTFLNRVQERLNTLSDVIFVFSENVSSFYLYPLPQ